MNAILFEEGFRELDLKFHSTERNFTLVIENYPAHPHIEKLRVNCFFYRLTHTLTGITDGSRLNSLTEQDVSKEFCSSNQ